MADTTTTVSQPNVVSSNIIGDGARVVAQTITDGIVTQLSQALPSVLATIFGRAGPGMDKAAKDGLKDAGKYFVNNVSSAIEKIGTIAIPGLLSLDTSQIEAMIKDGGIASLFKDSPIMALVTATAQLDPGTSKDLGDQFQKVINAVSETARPVVNVDFAAKEGAFVIMDKIPKAIQAIRSALLPMEDTWREVNQGALDLSVGFTTIEKQSGGFQTVTEQVQGVQAALRDAVNRTGISRQAFQSLSATFTNAGVDVSKLSTGLRGLTVNTSESAQAAGSAANVFGTELAEGGVEKARTAISGLEAAMLLLKGSGLDADSFASTQAFLTKELGLNSEQAALRFGLLREAQRGTRLSMRETSEAIMGGAKNLRYFGDNTEAVAQTFSRVAGVLAKDGKEGFAAEFTKQIVEGIGNLDMARKAFLSLGSGSSGGAIKGGLEMEEALANGDQDALAKIQDKIIKNVERLTGGQLQTRRQALDTGKGNQYYQQRELLKQFGIIAGSDQQAGAEQDALAKGQTLPPPQLNKQRGTEELLTRGREATGLTVSNLEAAQNITQVNADIAGTQAISADLASSTQNLLKFSTTFETFGQQITAFLKGPTEYKRIRQDKLRVDNPGLNEDQYQKMFKEKGVALSEKDLVAQKRAQRQDEGSSAKQAASEQKQRNVALGNPVAALAEDAKSARTKKQGETVPQLAGEEQSRRRNLGTTSAQIIDGLRKEFANQQPPPPPAAPQPQQPSQPLEPLGPPAPPPGTGPSAQNAVITNMGNQIAAAVQQGMANSDQSRPAPVFEIKIMIGDREIREISRAVAIKEINKATSGS